MEMDKTTMELIRVAESSTLTQHEFQKLLIKWSQEIKNKNLNLIIYIARVNNFKISEFEEKITKIRIKIALIKKYIHALDAEINNKIILYKSAAHAITNRELYCKDMGDIDLFYLKKENIKALYGKNFKRIKEWKISQLYEKSLRSPKYPYVTFDIHWKFWLLESKTIKEERNKEIEAISGLNNIAKFSDRYYTLLIAFECFRNLNYDSFSIFLFRQFYIEKEILSDKFMDSIITIMKVKSGLLKKDELKSCEVKAFTDFYNIEKNRKNPLRYYFKMLYIIKWFNSK